MTIEIDAQSGFCPGVVTAIRKAESVLADSGTLYCLGDIVHNGSEVERLRRLGLQTIDHADFQALTSARVLLRAHGEPPATYETAARNAITLVDATCPVVLGLQRRIRALAESPSQPQIVIYGKRGHAEVVGLVGQTGGRAIVIQSVEEAATLDFTRDIHLFSQTTMSLEGFRAVVSYLTAHILPPASFHYSDTICRQVANRLPHVSSFAARHDVVLFVCGEKSSNGRVLYEACRSVNPRTHMTPSPDALRAEWFEGAESVGICGATSTPTWLMEEVRQAVAKL
ncbi:MAG: 4-hydroxy-3-methylbut-2-enyl diphosphate reductase [Alloprevotella sp.]|nr:4-hydroxy-3-methylbut-2-enyl diphosphate reductase [Alloprevotella sp.]